MFIMERENIQLCNVPKTIEIAELSGYLHQIIKASTVYAVLLEQSLVQVYSPFHDTLESLESIVGAF